MVQFLFEDGGSDVAHIHACSVCDEQYNFMALCEFLFPHGQIYIKGYTSMCDNSVVN